MKPAHLAWWGTLGLVVPSICVIVALGALLVDLPAAVLVVTLLALASVAVLASRALSASRSALLESAQRIEDVQQGIDAVLWEADVASGGMTYISPHVERLLGYPHADWIRNPLLARRYMHPDDRERVWLDLDEVEALSGVHVREFRALRADGSWRWIRDHLRGLRDGEGKLLLRGLWLDITEEMSRDTRIRQYGELVERSPNGLLVIEPAPGGSTWRIHHLNAAMLELARPEPVAGTRHHGSTIGDALPWLSEARVLDTLALVATEEQGRSLSSYRFDHPVLDGRVFDLEIFPLSGGVVAISFDDVTERALSRERIEHQALHDTLTGLPNRVLLRDRIAAALARGRRAAEPLAVLLLDLDQFKSVNDTLGHTEGDSLLREVGTRVSGLLREGDTAARLGGDEFALLLTTDGDRTGALSLAERLEHELRKPFVLGGVEVHIGVSIGVVVAPDDGDEADDLLRRADLAMYRAKREGGGTRAFSESDESATTRRLSLLRDLRQAVERDQLVVHYQPVLDVETGRPVGVEALARWAHPTLGMIPPGEWIALAEMSNEIGAITRRVAGRAIDDVLFVGARTGLDLDVAVNLSVRDLSDETLVEWFADRLAASALAPQRVILEVTENEVMENTEVALSVLRELESLGVRLAIDDFGTGHSSLSRLRELPVSELKVDRSFVMDMHHEPEAEVYVRAILEMAHNLHLAVVAEGVEDLSALTVLRAMGCDRAQGYAIARPLALDALVDWLAEAAGAATGGPPGLGAGAGPSLRSPR